MTNESFSLPSELPATPHGIANCDPLLVQQTTRGAIQREGLLGVPAFLRENACDQSAQAIRNDRRSEEVANVFVYVCSPLASATNGSALRVDGGTVRSII